MDSHSNNKLDDQLESGVRYASAAKCKEEVTDIECPTGFVGEEMTGKEKEDIENIIKAAGGNNVVSDDMLHDIEIKEENIDYDEMDQYSDAGRNENGVDDKEESDGGKGDGGRDSENEFACSDPDDIVMPDCILDEMSEEKKEEDSRPRRKRPRRHHNRSHSSGNPGKADLFMPVLNVLFYHEENFFWYLPLC